MDKQREQQLLDELLHACQVCVKELHYNPTYARQMLIEHGAVETVRRLINEPQLPSGFSRLWEEHRLDLSFEAIMLRPEYAELFLVEDRRTAYDRLAETHAYVFLAGIQRP